MVAFTFAMRRYLIRLASGHLPNSVCKVWLGKNLGCCFAAKRCLCNAWQRSRTQNSRRLRENSGPILTSLWTKVHVILGQWRRSTVLPNAF